MQNGTEALQHWVVRLLGWMKGKTWRERGKANCLHSSGQSTKILPALFLHLSNWTWSHLNFWDMSTNTSLRCCPDDCFSCNILHIWYPFIIRLIKTIQTLRKPEDLVLFHTDFAFLVYIFDPPVLHMEHSMSPTEFCWGLFSPRAANKTLGGTVCICSSCRTTAGGQENQRQKGHQNYFLTHH